MGKAIIKKYIRSRLSLIETRNITGDIAKHNINVVIQDAPSPICSVLNIKPQELHLSFSFVIPTKTLSFLQFGQKAVNILDT